MADIAELGLKVRSDEVRKAGVDLDNMTNAAKRAYAAAGGVSASTKNASAAAAALAASSGRAAASLNAESVAAQKAANAMRMHAIAANSNVKATKNFNTANLAAQFQDVAVSAQMGMGALQIGLQQGTQLAAVIAAMENPVKGLGAAFASVISPVSLLVIGLTAAAAAGLQLVDWASLAAGAMNGLADVLLTIAPYATMAAAGLALVYAGAIIGGIVSVTTAIWGMVSALGAAALAFAAANPAAAFVLGLTVAVAAANVFRDEIARMLGVDIVGEAEKGANRIIGILVGAYDAAVAAWEALPGEFGRIGKLAGNALLDSLGGIHAKFRNPITGSETELFSFDFSSFKQQVDEVEVAAGAAAKAAYDAAQGVNYVEIIRGKISNAASGAAGKLKELAGWMTTVDEKAKKTGGKTEAEKYSDIVDGANRRIASLRAEQEALGLTEFEAAKLAYTTDLLNEAQRKGITLSAAQRAELSNLAETMASIEIATMKAKEAMDFAKDVTRGFIDDFRSGIEQGKSVWESFANAALNALDKIVDKLLNDVLDALFRVNSAGTGMGGGGGILGSLFGSLFGGGGFSAAAYAGIGQGLYAKGGVFDQSGVTAFAKGGVVNTPTVFPFAKGIGLMGEAGPEAIMPLRRGPDGRLGVAANDRAANQNGPQQININVNVDGANGDQHVIALVQEGVARGIGEFNKALPDRMNQINQNPRRRSA